MGCREALDRWSGEPRLSAEDLTNPLLYGCWESWNLYMWPEPCKHICGVAADEKWNQLLLRTSQVSSGARNRLLLPYRTSAMRSSGLVFPHSKAQTNPNQSNQRQEGALQWQKETFSCAWPASPPHILNIKPMTRQSKDREEVSPTYQKT